MTVPRQTLDWHQTWDQRRANPCQPHPKGRDTSGSRGTNSLRSFLLNEENAMRAENPVRDRNPQSTAQIAGHPLHPMLIPFPVAFLVATLVSDLIFWRTGNSGWSTASLYLLGAALVMAALAAVAGLI